MPAVFVPGGPYLPPGTFPLRLFSANYSAVASATTTFINEVNALVIIAGIDAVATNGSAAGPVYTDFFLQGVDFYHDSQSIGEGQGVTFSWRGAHLLEPGEQLDAQMVCISGEIDSMSAVGWGIITQIPNT